MAIWTNEFLKLLREKYPEQGPIIPELLMHFTPKAIKIKAGKGGILMRSANWTAEEDRILREQYPTSGTEISALLPNRTRTSIKRRASFLGVNSRDAYVPFTEEEDAIIREKFPTQGSNIPELRATRNVNSICARARRLGVDKPIREWSAEEDAILREKYPTCGRDIPELLSARTESAIKGRAKVLGLVPARAFWTDEDIAILKEKYPVLGSDIPELLTKFKESSIYTKARALGLSKPPDETTGFRRDSWDDTELKALAEEYPVYGSLAPSLVATRSAEAIRGKASALGIKAPAAWSEEDLAILRKEYLENGPAIPQLRERFKTSQITYMTKNLGLSQLNPTRCDWSEEDDNLIRKYYPTLGTNIPGLIETRSASSITHRASRLGVGARVTWSQEDIDILRDQYPTCGKQIPELLEKYTGSQIQKKANALGLTTNWSNRSWTPEEEKILQENYSNCTAEELRKLLPGRTVAGIYAYVNKTEAVKSKAQSIVWKNKNITSASSAYTGVDGKQYFFVRCAQCGAVILIPEDVIASFIHGDTCTERKVPEGFALPPAITRSGDC